MTDMLDIIKQEHDQLSNECLSLKSQRDEYESRGGFSISLSIFLCGRRTNFPHENVDLIS